MSWRTLWRLLLTLILLSEISAGQNSWEEKNQAGKRVGVCGRRAAQLTRSRHLDCRPD
jgi:hypothetical protein